MCSANSANPLGCTKAQAKNPDSSSQGMHGHWMGNFMHEIEARGYRCDYLGVHWYGGPNFGCFKSEMRKMYDQFGSKYPLLITEFAALIVLVCCAATAS
jgi:Glycosyl hydrolase catalytic core